MSIKRLLKAVAVAVVGAVILVAALLVVFQLKLNAEAERKIMTVLADQYPHWEVTVQRRRELSRRWDYQFYYQACFDLLLDGKEHRVAMVQGDDDGGSFSFGGEYPSMQACEAHFFRG